MNKQLTISSKVVLDNKVSEEKTTFKNKVLKTLFHAMHNTQKMLTTSMILALFILPASLDDTSGNSMDPTIHDGSYVFSFSRVGEIKRGDLVTFEKNEEVILKRVIGLAGDVVEWNENGLFVNGELLDEPYIRVSMESLTSRGFTYFTYYVEENSVYVLGDNRSNSTDSRNYGSISVESIRSKVLWFVNAY